MKKILILDDEQEILNIWFSHFKMWKMDVEIHTAKNGEQGLKLIRAVDDYDLIITDYKMPKMNGLEFMKIFKQEYLNKDVPIFFFTGYALEVSEKNNYENVLIFEKPMISERIKIYIKLSLKLIDHTI